MPTPNDYSAYPDAKGRFGDFGGLYVAETLMPPVLQLAEAYEAAKADPAFQAELVHIRALGLSQVNQELIAGISAMAVPVFDGFGQLALTIAAMGPSVLMDLSHDSPQAATLKALGQQLSLRLGAPAAMAQG